MTKFLKDSSSEFIDYCINFKNKLSNGNILISKARKFLSHHKFSGRNSNNNREQILDIIQQFLNGTNYYVNGDLLPEEFFSGKILLDIKNELKDFNITREQFNEYTTYLIKSHNRIQKFFSIRAKYRKENIDDIYEIMTICNNKIPLTKTSLFFDFIIKLCNDKFLVTNYITNGSQLILICDKLHKYSVSKIHLDKRISDNKNPCGICGEDTSGNNIFLRNKVYNTEQTIKSILYNKNIEFISYCSNSRMVNVKCPLCREDKAVHSCNIKSWNGCIKCSNEICGNKYTDNEINRICPVLKYVHNENIDFTQFINNGVIYINRIIFQKLKTNPSEHSINIMNLLESIKDPLLPIISDKECYNDYENIKADNTQIIENSISSNKNGRHKFLNKIMFPVMIKGKKYNKISYFDAWNDMCYRKKLVDRMLEKDYLMNNNSLYSCHACTYGIVYNFPPNVAKCLYNYFHATRVLDFCAGYGGRLTGFWTSNAKEYVGIDPNKNIPYNKVIEKLKQYDEQDKKVTIINECAEEVDYSTLGKFDFIFTSPPYFNTEIYSDDKCQSSFKYQEFKIWLENFLFKTLSKVSEVIINTGILAINIKDTPKYNIIQPMIEFIVSLGFVQCPSILLGQPKRYKNTKSEYIYIFLKQ